MLTLRKYQRECLDAIASNYKNGNCRQLVSLPTASGKTVVFASLIKESEGKSLVLAHTNELLEQAREKIQMIAPNLSVGLVNADSKEFDFPVIVSSIQSARQPNNLAELQAQNFNLLVYDECHHAASETSRNILNALGFGCKTDRLLCGFTATAFRQDGKGLKEVFDTVAYQRTIKEMIADGYLCPPKGIKVSTDIDLSKVKMGDGDFQAESLAKVMDVPEIRQIVVDAYQKEGEGRQTICFGVNIQHAHNLSSLFNDFGISSEAIHGRMSKSEREKVLNRYRSGQIQVLCNCQVLTEGFDAPETSCVIVARPTQSKGLYQQMAGRGLRLYPNKRDCIIIDLCTKHHSLCNTVTLLEDSNDIKEAEKSEKSDQLGVVESFPANLNQKLKAALISFDPLGQEFTWTCNESNIYVLKGDNIRLGIVPINEDRYRVILASENGSQTISDDLNFEYSFAAAEDFARSNRDVFIVSDREAKWRNLPASAKQIALIRSKGYRAGLDKLTRGQASDIISSGTLRGG